MNRTTAYTPVANDEVIKDHIEKGQWVEPIKVAVIQPRSKKQQPRSCCTIMFIILGVLFGLSILMCTMAVTWGYFWTKHQVQRFTVPEGHIYPITPIPSAELDIVTDHAKLFFDKLRANQIPSDDFIVSLDALNGYIARSDYLRGHAQVVMEPNGQMRMDLSLPMDMLPGGKDRYFDATLHLSIHDEKDGPASIFMTTLETMYPVSGIVGALWSTELSFERQKPRTYHSFTTTLVVRILSGKFLNWIIPQDYIDQHDNVIYNILDDPDMDNKQEFVNVMEGIQHIRITGEGDISFTAKRDKNAPVADMGDDEDDYNNAAKASKDSVLYLMEEDETEEGYDNENMETTTNAIASTTTPATITFCGYGARKLLAHVFA